MTIAQFMAKQSTAKLRQIRDNDRMDSDARDAARLEILDRIARNGRA